MLHQGNNPSQSIFISWQEVCTADLCHGVESYYLLTKWFTVDFRKPQKVMPQELPRMMIPPGCWVSTQAKANTFSGTDSSIPGGEPFPPQHTFCGIWMCSSAQGNYGTPIPDFWGHFLSPSASVIAETALLLSFSGTMNSKLFSNQNSKWMKFYLGLLLF